MEKGRCLYPLIAGRREASERSEMITQLVYGESYEIMEEILDWIKVKIDRDAYECWIDKKLHSPFEVYSDERILIEAFNKIEGNELLLPASSLIDHSKGNLLIEESISDTALKFLGAPYLWGGKSIWGVDCSGFVQLVYQIHGINISRDAYQQADWGELIEFNSLIEAGDLAFFSKKDDDKISHVGICLADEKIIHASGKIRIDKLDHHGIFNDDLNKYTHELRIVKRIKKAAV